MTIVDALEIAEHVIVVATLSAPFIPPLAKYSPWLEKIRKFVNILALNIGNAKNAK